MALKANESQLKPGLLWSEEILLWIKIWTDIIRGDIFVHRRYMGPKT